MVRTRYQIPKPHLFSLEDYRVSNTKLPPFVYYLYIRLFGYFIDHSRCFSYNILSLYTIFQLRVVRPVSFPFTEPHPLCKHKLSLWSSGSTDSRFHPVLDIMK